MQWWRSDQWRKLAEHAEDPSSARLALAASAAEVGVYGLETDRDLLAKACEDSSVVLAFHSSGDDESYPEWASDSLDQWERNAAALVAAGVSKPVAAQRASLVLGTTVPHNGFITAASQPGATGDDLVRAADAALIEECAQYVRLGDVGKAWDESAVRRDEVGRFAEEPDESAVSFQVIGGAKYRIKERDLVRSHEPERPVAQKRANTDAEILGYKDEHAEARRAKKQARAKRAQRARKAYSSRAAAAEAAAKKEAVARNEARRAWASEHEAVAERAGFKGATRAGAAERQRSRSRLRMGDRARIRPPDDVDTDEGLSPAGQQGQRDMERHPVELGLMLNSRITAFGTGGSVTSVPRMTSGGVQRAVSFSNPGVHMVGVDTGSERLSADMGLYLESVMEMVEKAALDYGATAAGTDPQIAQNLNDYAQAAFRYSAGKLSRTMSSSNLLPGDLDLDSVYLTMRVGSAANNGEDLLLVPVSALRSPESSLSVRNGEAVLRLKADAERPFYHGSLSGGALKKLAPEASVEATGSLSTDGMVRFGKSDWDESEVRRDDIGRFAHAGERVRQRPAVSTDAGDRGPDAQELARIAAERRKARALRARNARSVRAVAEVRREAAPERVRQRVETATRAAEPERARPDGGRARSRSILYSPDASRKAPAPAQAPPEKAQRAAREAEREKPKVNVLIQRHGDEDEHAAWLAEMSGRRAVAEQAVPAAEQERARLVLRPGGQERAAEAKRNAVRVAAREKESVKARAFAQEMRRLREESKAAEAVRAAEREKAALAEQESKRAKAATTEKKPEPAKAGPLRRRNFILPSATSDLVLAFQRRTNPNITYYAIAEGAVVHEDEDFIDAIGGKSEPGGRGGDEDQEEGWMETDNEWFVPEAAEVLEEMDEATRSGTPLIIGVQGTGYANDPFDVWIEREAEDDEVYDKIRRVRLEKSVRKRRKLRRL